MAVYQAEKHIRQALDSLCVQTYTNFELIISDNASTDETSKICQEYANLDHRIKYVRQQTNLGAAGNFGFVLNAASSAIFVKLIRSWEDLIQKLLESYLMSKLEKYTVNFSEL